MHINWFPGHMKKTKELIKENLKLVDVVVELLDARIPISSKNPEIDGLIGNKTKVVVLNKFDLSDPKILDEWIKYYHDKGICAIPINSLTGEGINRLIHELKLSFQDKLDKMLSKGMKPRAARVMIVGIPNVGKSSLINKLAGKKSAKTGNKPGVTRGKQWIKIKKDLDLFDTPGILWPKIDDLETGLKLAFTGAIKDEILDIDEIAFKLVDFLNENYKEELFERFKLTGEYESSLEIMEEIARNRGCLVSGNMVDYTKVSRLILDEFRKGIIGRVTLEKPSE